MKEIGMRTHSYSTFWIGAVLVAGAALLWLELALAIVFAILTVFALVLSLARRLWTRKQTARGPVTVEGHYAKSNE